MTYNLADLFESVADAIPDNIAIVSAERRLSYRELDERATRLANHWAGLGLGRGDHIGLQLRNGTEYIEGMLAAYKLRAVPINVNYNYVAGELDYLYRDADMVALITHQAFAPRVAEAAGGIETLRHVACVADASGEAVDQGFADYEQYVEPGEAFADYPHARREMAVEMLFLLPCIAGLVLGFMAGAKLPVGPPPVIVQAVSGSLLGYLVGGGVVWAVRILGTLGFGKEAMGLGDVHLLGAVGAVLGWADPIFIFLLAPFFGLAWAVLSMGFSSLLHKKRRELPYGPHLAVATLVVILCRPVVSWVQVTYLPGVPQPGLVQAAPSTGPSSAPRP